MIAVKPIGSRDTVAIRHAVLRAGLPVETCYWDKDEVYGTFHLGGYVGDTHAGVCTLQREPHFATGAEAYRLRGMAVLPEFRGEGVGALMLRVAEDCVFRLGYTALWCDARIGAVDFYRRYGWRAVGELFEIPAAGPHYRMEKTLTEHVCL